MADYWKSNPRKYCEVCKCWFGDNKASIEFHEGGRRHQANVAKQLKNARVRSAESQKEQVNIAKTLSEIEHAALGAYQKDLEGGQVKKAKVPVTPEINQLEQIQLFLKAEQESAERELEKKKIEALAQQKVQEIQTKAAVEAYNAYSSSYIVQSSWQQCYSPEGYIYYYNSATGVSQWHPPVEFQPPPPPPPPLPSSSGARPTSEGQTSADEARVSANSTHSLNETGGVKRPLADEAGVEDDENTHHLPKRRDPYGAWTVVSVREINQDAAAHQPVAEEDKQEEKEGENLNNEEEVQFKEKTLSGQLGDDDDEEDSNSKGELKGDFKRFSFKKRTNKGRPQTRQRTSDV